MSKKPPKDPNKAAKAMIDRLIDKTEGKNPAAVALGRLGGLKGGHARAKTLTPEQRSAAAKKAAKARWSKKPDKK